MSFGYGLLTYLIVFLTPRVEKLIFRSAKDFLQNIKIVGYEWTFDHLESELASPPMGPQLYTKNGLLEKGCQTLKILYLTLLFPELL